MTNIGLHSVFTTVGWTAVVLLIMFSAGRIFGVGDGDTDTHDGEGGGNGIHGAAINPFAPTNLAAFFALFGLVGKEMLDSGYSSFLAIGGGVLAGICGMLLIGGVFMLLGKLTQSGTQDPSKMVGQTATVTARIPPKHSGIGLISVMTASGTHELSAYSDGEEEIPSGRRVKIVALESPTTVLIEAA